MQKLPYSYTYMWSARQHNVYCITAQAQRTHPRIERIHTDSSFFPLHIFRLYDIPTPLP